MRRIVLQLLVIDSVALKARNQSQLEGVAGSVKKRRQLLLHLAVLALSKAQALKSSAKSKASAVQLRQKSTNTSTETLIE